MDKNRLPRARYFAVLHLILIFACVPLVATAQDAQFQTVASLGRPPSNPTTPLLQATDGKFYGTTPNGGANGSGTIFRIDSSGVLETLYSFGPLLQPEAALIQASDGQFYGTAAAGGNDSSVFFQLSSSGTLTVLHTFTLSEGSYPSGALLQAADGDFYGSARYGGAHGFGVIFKVDASGNLTRLHSFNSSDGANPYAGLVQATNGDFYGTTLNGGENGFGTVFKMDSSGRLVTMHSFTALDGAGPAAALIRATDGNFYETTESGGTAGLGTVFKMDFAGNVSMLHRFVGADGQEPIGALLEASDGNLYGTTSGGGRNGDGTVFRLDASGSLRTLHDFEWTDGANPVAALIQAVDGRLYGTAKGGGQASGGTIFVTDFTGKARAIYRFPPGIEGQLPYAGLLQAADGYFYGTTSAGGAANLGTIFRMNASGQMMRLHSFTGIDGAAPFAALIQGADGNFYGTTQFGGLEDCELGCGLLFRMDSSGNVTVLYRFRGPGYNDGAYPYAALLQATNGNFYGTTLQGGAINRGTVFKMDSAGNETTLHSFQFLDGTFPWAGLIQATDGNLYGTTLYGGGGLQCYGDCGTVFAMDVGGNLTTLHAFAGPADGKWPHAGLIQAYDGEFYGTTEGGGTYGGGTVFKINHEGSFTTIYDINLRDLGFPEGALIQTSDGNFYGTAYAGGNEKGALFKVDSAGDFTDYHDFLGPDGAHPNAGLLKGLDGSLYGTTVYGGSNGQGAVFRVLAPGTLRIADMTVRCGQAGGYTYSTISGVFSNVPITVTLGGNTASVIARTPTTIEIAAPPGTAGEVADLTVAEFAANSATVKLTRAFAYDFADVLWWSPFHDFICRVVRTGIAAGCGSGNFCPSDSVLRSQMAVLLLQGEHGSIDAPPPADCATYPFADVPCPSVFADYILQAYTEGVMNGCSTSPLLFCPSNPVSRADMAVFLLAAKHGTGYAPPACSGVFVDVPCPSPFTNWIEQLYAEGITGGCSTNPLTYCPGEAVTREQMAVFLTATFALQ